MNWSNLPAHILEKIFYHSTKRDRPSELHNEWLDSIQKLEKVCVGWQSVIFASNSLFSHEYCILHCSQHEIERVERLAKAGYLRLVKNIRLANPEAMKRIRNCIEGNSFDHICVETSRITHPYSEAKAKELGEKYPGRVKSLVQINPIQKGYVNTITLNDDSNWKLLNDDTVGENPGYHVLGYCTDWTSENLASLLDFLSLCSQVKSFDFRFLMVDQQSAVLFWKLLLRQIHCNPYPKRIELQLYFEYDLQADSAELDWSFIKDFDCTGSGSIQEFKFVEFELNDTGAHEIIGQIDWTYLTNAVSIDQLTLQFHGQSVEEVTSSLEFIDKMINKVRTLYFQTEEITDQMMNTIQNMGPV